MADLHFNDQSFAVESLSLKIGSGFNQRLCKVDAEFILEVDLETKKIPLRLTSKELWDQSEPRGEHSELEPEAEMELGYPQAGISSYSRYPMLDYGVGGIFYPVLFQPYENSSFKSQPLDYSEPTRIRSVSDLKSYKFSTRGHKEGRVFDWIVDTEQWKMVWVCISFGGFWSRELRLVSTDIIDSISPLKSRVYMNLKDQDLYSLRPFLPNECINSKNIVALYDYLGRPQKSKSA